MLQAMFKKIGKSKKGFTLIELLVVIAILGILAAILIPVVGGYISTSKQSVADADARTVYSAAATVVAQNPSLTFASYNATADHTTDSAKAVMGDSDLNPYIGSHNFTITSITFNTDGSPDVVKISDNGKTGTYSRPTT